MSPPQETTSQQALTPVERSGVALNTARFLGFGLLYVVLSPVLIAYNKYLIHEGRFPYAIPLVLIHMLFCSCFTGMLFLLRPSLFPSLTDPLKKVPVDQSLIRDGAVPIACMFSGQLALTNTAYLHCSVAFLQMMKEGNLVLVYAFSLMAALERFNWLNFRVLMVVLVGTAITIRGEMHFSNTGFAIQGTGQLFESGKIVLMAMLLSNHGKKLDALTYILVVMPICCIVLCCFLFGLFLHPIEQFATPQWSEVIAWWPHLLANAGVAFCLNVTIALFVKNSSAVAFILAGIVKDTMIVCVSGLFLEEIVSALQVAGFALQLVAILVWSLMKVFPDKFNDGVVRGIASTLFGYESASENTEVLVAGKGQQAEYGAGGDQSKC